MVPDVPRAPACLVPLSLGGEGGHPSPSPSQSTREQWRSRLCYLDVLCSFGSEHRRSSEGAPGLASGTGDHGGSRCLDGPQLPGGLRGPLPFLGALWSPTPSPPGSSLPACLSKCFLLLTKYQELGFVCDFWIKYGRKGVSSPGPDKALMKHCTCTQLTLLSPRKHLSFNLEMGTLGKG